MTPHRSRFSRLRAAALPPMMLLTLGLALSGCANYQQAGAASLYRTDVHTVAVPIFTNIDYSRGDEFALTKAIVTQIEQRTPYKVVSREKADTILEGQITQVRRQSISSDRSSSLPQEQLYGIRVDFVWKDLRTGQILCERKGFEQTNTAYPTLGEGRETAALNTAESLALAIVQEMESDW